MNVACIGMGWWSDVLADAIKRSGRMKIAACYTRSRDKREAFARKYDCRAAATYEEILGDRRIEAIINTTPNDVHLETTRRRGGGRQARVPRQADRQHHRRRARHHRGVPQGEGGAGARLPAPAREPFPLDQAADRAGEFGKLVNAEANISRDRLGKIDLTSWRYTAEGMPGGVMLQIGIHYTDVLEYLIGPVKAVSGRFARLVLPGDNPDVASLVLEHENGALSTLNASYASASEYYLMNIYGKEASAYYDLHQGLRLLKRGTTSR